VAIINSRKNLFPANILTPSKFEKPYGSVG